MNKKGDIYDKSVWLLLIFLIGGILLGILATRNIIPFGGSLICPAG